MSRRVAGGGQRDIEFRDPRGATRGGGSQYGYSIQSGRRANIPNFDITRAWAMYESCGLVYRMINVIADAVAGLPFRAGKDPEQPGDFNMNSPLARLLGPPPEGPSGQLSSAMLWKSAVINYLVTGKFAWEIEYLKKNYGHNADVKRLWPLVMAQFEALPDYGGADFFKGYKLTPPDGGPPVTYSMEEVIYGWRMSPQDPRKAESVLESLRTNILTLIELETYNYSYLRNNAIPSFILIHGQMPDQDTKDAFDRKFMNNHAGSANANKPIMVEVAGDMQTGKVEGNIQIEQLGATNKDSKLVEIYEQQIQAVSGGLGVPLSLLDASGRTFSNAGQEGTNFWTVTMKPLLRDLQDHINRDLAPKLGDEIGWFDLSEVQELRPVLSQGVLFSDLKDDMTRTERRSVGLGLGEVDEQELMKEKQQGIDMMRQTALATNIVNPPPGDPGAGKPPAPAAKNGSADDEKQQDKPASNVVPIKKKAAATRVFGDLIESSREPAITAATRLLVRTMGRYDQRSEHAAVTRTEGKRGKTALSASVQAAPRVAALYDSDFWAEELRSSLAAVYEASIGHLGTALGTYEEAGNLDAWVDARSGELAAMLVARRCALLMDGMGDPDLTQDQAAVHIRAVHSHGEDLATLATIMVDDVLGMVATVPTTRVEDLLTAMLSDQIDVDEAVKGLTARG